MISLRFMLVFIVSYLLGSISFAIVISKGIYKKDIRDFGSGNAGMTNILRTFGKKAAVLTFAGDTLKGAAAVWFARFIMRDMIIPTAPVATNSLIIFSHEINYTSIEVAETAVFIAVFGAILGHLYPIYFKFKGGKGISVICGSMLAATPITTAISFSLFFLIVFTTRIVSLASILSCCSYPFVTMAYFAITDTFSRPNLIASLFFPLIVIYTHRANIKRLIHGTEYKFGKK